MRLVARRAALAGLRLLPKHLLSRLAGRAATVRLPAPLQRWEIGLFGRAVGADFSEVGDTIDSFSCLQEFFVRALREGVRPVDPAPDAVVAPCDGQWGISGTIAAGTLLQIKGQRYSLAALLSDAAAAAQFEGGAYATFYLAPRDYHRFHMPCAAHVRRAIYVPGALWPVNRLGVENVRGLFARNERLCAFFTVGGTAIDLCLVAVGATMVGSVRVRFDDMRTNARGGRRIDRTYTDPLPHFAKGEAWGRFEFGSTIVMLSMPDLLTLDEHPPGSRLRVGERIGTQFV